MFTALEIENFKAFGTRTRIPLAPITLIFGENSAGKSSILQCLNLLKQTIEGRNTNAVLLPKAENGIVDLGSFQDILYNHDLTQPFKVKLDFKNRYSEPTSIEFSFKRESLDNDVTLEHILLFSHEYIDHIAEFKVDIPFFNQTAYGGEILNTVSCAQIPSKSIWEGYFQCASKYRHTILHALQRYEKWITECENPKSNSLVHELRTFFDQDLDLESFIEFFIKYEKTRLLPLNNFLPVFSEEYGDEKNIFDSNPELRKIKKKVLPNFTDKLFRASRELHYLLLKKLYPLAPFRRPSERGYIFKGITPKGVGYHGEDMPDLLYSNPKKILQNTNEWLKKLEIGYQLAIVKLGHPAKELFDIRLIDTRRKNKVDIGLSDVGFGISQILPLIVQSLSEECQTISIEQPELHIHPKLQADLGDLFINAAMGEQKNSFLIETHSEHLILRILRRIRETAAGELPEGMPGITPDDVSIIYVQPGKEGSKVIHIPANEDGGFDKPWPNGFFAERIKELF